MAVFLSCLLIFKLMYLHPAFPTMCGDCLCLLLYQTAETRGNLLRRGVSTGQMLYACAMPLLLFIEIRPTKCSILFQQCTSCLYLNSFLMMFCVSTSPLCLFLKTSHGVLTPPFLHESHSLPLTASRQRNGFGRTDILSQCNL